MRNFTRRFHFAFQGLRWLAADSSIRLHMLIGSIVLIGGWLLGFHYWHLCILALCVAFVLCAEAFNSALERLIDHLHSAHHPEIGKIKDMCAAAVLLAAMGSFLCAVWVFLDFYFK